MSPAATAARYTATDLVREAAERSLESSERLITDWVSVGLLDKPEHRSLGRGRGSAPGTWPENQRQLFFVLLQKRLETKRIRTLCNVPAALWLYFGIDYVPCRQLRSCLATFAGAIRTSSARAARQSAKEVSKLLLPEGLSRSRRKDLKDRLTDAIVFATVGGRVDFEALREVARAVFDPEEEGRVAGPPDALLSGDAWVRVLEARLAGIALIAPDQDSPDDRVLEDARLAHHRELVRLLERQPDLERDPEVGILFETSTFEALVNSACLDLLTVLGFLELNREQGG